MGRALELSFEWDLDQPQQHDFRSIRRPWPIRRGAGEPLNEWARAGQFSICLSPRRSASKTVNDIINLVGELLACARSLDRFLARAHSVHAGHQKGRTTSVSRPAGRVASAARLCQRPTMVGADDLPPKRPECLSRLAARRGCLAGISSLQRRSTEPRHMTSADRKMRRLESSEPQVLTA